MERDTVGLIFIANKMKIHLYMLGTFMINWISRNMECSLTIAIKRNISGFRNIKVG